MAKRTREHILHDADLLITKLEDGQLEIRKVLVIDGEQVYHRHVIVPGDTLTKEDPRVQAVAQQVQTPDIITAYKKIQQEIATRNAR